MTRRAVGGVVGFVAAAACATTLAIAWAASIAVPATARGDEPAPTLRNASFEDAGTPDAAPPGWTFAEGARTVAGPGGPAAGKASVAALDASAASAGTSSLRLSGDPETTSWRVVRQTVPVRPRSWVRLSVAARSADVAPSQGQFRNANAFLEFVDAAGKRLAFVATAVLPRASDWTPLECEAFVPEGATEARIGLFLSMSGTVWFDDVRFESNAADAATAEGRAFLFDRFADRARRTYPFFGVAGRPKADEWISTHRAKCVAAEGNALFFAFRDWLADLRDVHVVMETPKGPLSTVGPSDAPRNWNIEAIRKRLTATVASGRNLLAGRVGTGKDAIGYVLVGTWSRGLDLTPEQLDAALDALADAKALVIDVRANGGGDEAWAARVAGRFTSTDVPFGRARVRDPAKPAATDAFLAPTVRLLRPLSASSDAKPADTRPVIVLQGPYCVSSNEAFVQMMAALPTVTTMGANTRGASGNPAPIDLGPNTRVLLPRWQTLTLGGDLLEGRGSDPELRAEFPAGAFAAADPLLDAALERLSK